MKVRAEIKLLVLLTLILSLGLSVVNLVALSNYKRQILEKIDSEVELYKLAVDYGVSLKLPPYIVISPKPPGERWSVAGKVNDEFFFVNEDYVQSELRRFAFYLFIWEVPIVVLTILVAYKTVTLFIKREKEAKELVKTFFLLFTHKLGNFLSLNKINLEILEMKCPNEKALSRIKQAYSILESDFKKSLNYISTFEEDAEKENVDIGPILEKLALKYHSLFPDKKLELVLPHFTVKAKRREVESIFQILIENAFKYSRSFVKISLNFEGSKPIIEIENDPGITTPGSGIGLKLAHFLAERLNWKLEVIPGRKLFKVRVYVK